jgi:hypothetical protein
MHSPGGEPNRIDPALKRGEQQAQNRMNSWNNAMSSPESFMNSLRSRQNNFDYKNIFGSDASAKTRAQNLGRMVTECVPCFGRILDKNNLLPSGDLLEVHALNIRLRLDFIKQIKDLFRDPGLYIDICELLKLLSSLCPQDLLAMLSLLTQYLTKLNLDIKFNLDFIVNLVGPILSPFLNGLSQWLDKWVQLILEPMICVTDHINEVILTAQKVPIAIKDANYFASVDVGLKQEVGPGPLLNNDVGAKAAVGTDNRNNVSWAAGEIYRYEEVNQNKYNHPIPELPVEETRLAGEELREEILTHSGFETPQHVRDDLNARWAEARKKQALRNQKREDLEKKRSSKGNWEDNYKKPERRASKPDQAQKYFDPSPLINSIVQLRNIVQGAIQYVKDWFTYLTQMIYDLLGVELGWMQKKTGTSYLKTNIIQLIKMIQVILQAISKNGLECGANSNFNTIQMKDLLEDGLNKNSQYKFAVEDDGTISMLPPGRKQVSIKDLSDNIKKKIEQKSIDTGVGKVNEKPTAEAEMREKVKESGIIIKSCLKDVSSEELSKVRSWISDFERRSS